MTSKSKIDPNDTKQESNQCASESKQCNGTHKSDTQAPSDIDYMHPDGKPIAADKVSDDQSVEDAVQDLKSTQKSLAEADGHHVCNDRCQTHHKVVAKGADKS